MLIIFFVGNGVLGQANSIEKEATRKKLMKYFAKQENNHIITCCPELAKDLDPTVSLESWMLEKNFGLNVLMGESEKPVRQVIKKNKPLSIDTSGLSINGYSELKTLNYIKQK